MTNTLFIFVCNLSTFTYYFCCFIYSVRRWFSNVEQYSHVLRLCIANKIWQKFACLCWKKMSSLQKIYFLGAQMTGQVRPRQTLYACVRHCVLVNSCTDKICFVNSFCLREKESVRPWFHHHPLVEEIYKLHNGRSIPARRNRDLVMGALLLLHKIPSGDIIDAPRAPHSLTR